MKGQVQTAGTAILLQADTTTPFIMKDALSQVFLHMRSITSQSHFNAMFCHILLGLVDGIFAIMKYTRRQNSVRLAF